MRRIIKIHALDPLAWLYTELCTWFLMISKKVRKKDLAKDTIDLYYNRHDSIPEIANKLGRSRRTIYRWLQLEKKGQVLDRARVKMPQTRRKRIIATILDRILALKQELPTRTAVKIR